MAFFCEWSLQEWNASEAWGRLARVRWKIGRDPSSFGFSNQVTFKVTVPIVVHPKLLSNSSISSLLPLPTFSRLNHESRLRPVRSVPCAIDVYSTGTWASGGRHLQIGYLRPNEFGG